MLERKFPLQKRRKLGLRSARTTCGSLRSSSSGKAAVAAAASSTARLCSSSILSPSARRRNVPLPPSVCCGLIGTYVQRTAREARRRSCKIGFGRSKDRKSALTCALPAILGIWRIRLSFPPLPRARLGKGGKASRLRPGPSSRGRSLYPTSGCDRTMCQRGQLSANCLAADFETILAIDRKSRFVNRFGGSA